MADGGATGGKTRSRLAAAGAAAACTVALFLSMSRTAQTPHMALAGMALLAGLFRALGLWTPEPGARSLAQSLQPLPGEPRWAAPCWSIPCAPALFATIALTFGTAALPYAFSAGLLALSASALRRPALLVFVVASLLYLPQLGAYAL